MRADRQTDRHNKANSQLSKFCERACVKRWRFSEANISQTKALDTTKYHYQYSYGQMVSGIGRSRLEWKSLDADGIYP